MIPKPDFKGPMNKAFSEISGELRSMDETGKNVLDAMNFKNMINAELKETENQSKYPFLDFLKDKSNMSDIKKVLSTGKKTSSWQKRREIKKYLKDKNEIDDFLRSYQNYFSEKREETKEATASGGSGQYSTLFSGEMKETQKNQNKNVKKIPEKKSKEHSQDDGESYTKVKKMETKEATSSASSGQYSTNKVWAKSMNKKDFRGYSKTQVPGGSFVRVKKKCKKFPYCNQGDIKALTLFENKTLQKVITKISLERNIHEDIIYEVILEELNKTNINNIYK